MKGTHRNVSRATKGVKLLDWQKAFTAINRTRAAVERVIANFKKSLAKQVGLTVNFDSLALEGSSIIFQPKDILVDPAGVTTHIDFIVVADE